MSPVRWLALLTAAVGAILAAPLGLFEHPELVDLPSHVVRHELVHRLPGDAVLDELFVVSWRLLPNLAVDLLVVPLQVVLSASAATRLVLAAGVVGWVVAPMVLHRALWGEWSVWPLASALVVYNAMLYMGFENYYVTVPLVMLILAGWVATEAAGHDPRRLVALAAAALVVWIGHLVAWGVLGLCIGAWELGRADDRVRRLVHVGLAFLPGAMLFVGLQWWHPAEIDGWTELVGPGWSRIRVLLAPILQFEPAVDLVHLLVLLPSLLLVPFVFGRLEVHPRGAWVVGALAAASLVMPSVLLGIYYMDQRVPCVLVPVLFAASRVRVSRPVGAALAGVVVVGLGLRLGFLLPRWADHDREIATLHREVVPLLRPGERVLVGGRVDIRKFHLADGLVPRARVFMPNLFTGAQLLDVTDAVRAINHPAPDIPSGAVLRDAATGQGRFAPDGDPFDQAYLRDWPVHYDVLLWLEPDASPPVRDRLRLVGQGAGYRLYRTLSAGAGDED